MASQIQAGTGGRAAGYRTAYAIFEGGGAKGITHLGALKALEKENLALVGVAGSSAGAIIAALTAVGYSADDLFAEDGALDVLSRQKVPQSPLDLLGREDWTRFRKLKRSLRASLILLVLAILAIIAALLMWSRWSLVAVAFAGVFILWAIVRSGPLRWAARRIIGHRGLFSTLPMRDKLNELLRQKLKQHYSDLGKPTRNLPKLICFKHIDPAEVKRCCRLKIVVSDARSGQMMMFDHNDGNVVVADAVAASASIPFAFEPPKVRGTAFDPEPEFVDGGLVSNLPAWSFRTEKKALEREQGGPPIPIFAFTLAANAHGESPEGRESRLRRLRRFAIEVIQTGIFGSQAIVQGFVSDLVVIDLPSPLNTLSFDCTREEALAAYRAGRDEAGLQLARRRQVAEVTERAVSAILDLANEETRKRRENEGKAVPRLRAALIDPVDERADDSRATALRVIASANMDDDADDRLELDIRNQIAPRAFAERAPLYAEMSGRTARDLWMTKYEHALVRTDVVSVICVPVYARATTRPGETSPQRILCIDSSDSLQAEFEDPTFMAMLTDASATVSRTLIEETIP